VHVTHYWSCRVKLLHACLLFLECRLSWMRPVTNSHTQTLRWVKCRLVPGYIFYQSLNVGINRLALYYKHTIIKKHVNVVLVCCKVYALELDCWWSIVSRLGPWRMVCRDCWTRWRERKSTLQLRNSPSQTWWWGCTTLRVTEHVQLVLIELQPRPQAGEWPGDEATGDHEPSTIVDLKLALRPHATFATCVHN